MGTVAAAMLVALVAQDQTALRAAPHDNAPKQTLLAAGDWLEVRGEQQGYLRVYDHRHERPGYVKPAQVRTVTLDEANAPSLRAIVDYLRDAPGQESLGIGYVALYLKAAPANAIGPDVWDALGTMAERLAERASARTARVGDGGAAEEIQVAESYGLHFLSFDEGGMTRVCYDGEAYARVIAAGGDPKLRVKAALGVTDPSCVDPSVGTTFALEKANERKTVLDAVDASSLSEEVPASDRAKLHVRKAMALADVAYYSARGGAWPDAEGAAAAAKREMLEVDRAQMADDDRPAYEEAALRVSAVRWAAEPPAPRSEAIDLTLAPGAPGQTCVRLQAHASKDAPFESCSYGVLWPSSVRVSPRGDVVTIVAEPMPGWSELHVFKKSADGWKADAVPPALVDPDVGYVEIAGFAPAGDKMLVVREYRASGPLGAPHTLAPWLTRTFQVMGVEDFRVEREARSLGGLPRGERWETASWKQGTLALR